jgi:hypothetical protein
MVLGDKKDLSPEGLALPMHGGSAAMAHTGRFGWQRNNKRSGTAEGRITGPGGVLLS